MPGSRSSSRPALAGILALTLAGCAPLPGRALDPLVPALGLSRAEGREGSRQAWTGWYRDSRGEGKISAALTIQAESLSGSWPLQPEGPRTFAGTLGSDGRTLTFTIEGADGGCPATLEGRGEYVGDRIHGAYSGRDCKGPVTWGYLELRKE